MHAKLFPRAKSKIKSLPNPYFVHPQSPPNPRHQLASGPLRDASLVQENLSPCAIRDPTTAWCSSCSTVGCPFHDQAWCLVPSVSTIVHGSSLHSILDSWATAPKHGWFIASSSLVATCFLCKFGRFRSTCFVSVFYTETWFFFFSVHLCLKRSS